MKRNNRVLLPLNRPDYTLNCIRKIIELQKGKTIDLIHFVGADPNETDYFPLEDLIELAEQFPEIDKCYRCDVREIVNGLEEMANSERLLYRYQLKHIVLIRALAYQIEAGDYDELIYYSQYCDHRLTEVPASMTLKDPECICLRKEMDNASVAEKRFFVSNALGFDDHKPEFGYAMEEQDIKELCRRILNTLVIEEVDYRNINRV